MAIDLEQFHQVFIEESYENIDILEQTLVDIDMDASIDPETINTIFRAAHSIKGGSATFGFSEVTDFTHLIETLLDEVREGARPLTRELVNALLKSCDCLREWFDDLQAKRVLTDENSKPLVEVFQKLLITGSNSPADQSKAEPLKTVDELSDKAVHLWEITFIPDPSILLSGNEPIRLFRQLEQLGEFEALADVSQVKAWEKLTVDECLIRWQMTLKSKCEKDEIEEIFEWVIDECTLTIEQPTDQEVSNQQNADTLLNEESLIDSSVNDTVISEKNSKKTPADVAASSMRVGIDKVDHLINLVGELVITQSMLCELGNNFDMSKIERLSNGLDQLLQNTKDLQDNVMRIRMLPISFAFNRFPRMIRDLSEKMGKKINLQINGEQTELDKTIMEKIGDPLIHLVRNAIDHGIEEIEERVAAGKAGTGTITLDAYHKGGNIVIEIKDDGKGIDVALIAKKAIEKGIVTDTMGLSDSQITELIFSPGFSTTATVNDLSGRGVGMDVVRRNIQALGGRIEIESAQGLGSTFRVHLPLTLSILEGQLIQVGNQVYIIPLISIIESLQIKPESMNNISGKLQVYQLRDENIPVINIKEVFALPTDADNFENSLLVVVEAAGNKVALIIDDLLAQQQVVIKSLETNYKKVEGISSATILGDGSVAMIVDVPELMALAKNRLRLSDKTAA